VWQIDALNSLDDGIMDAIQAFETRRNVHLLYSLMHV
jgi:hypothetical protein